MQNEANGFYPFLAQNYNRLRGRAKYQWIFSPTAPEKLTDQRARSLADFADFVPPHISSIYLGGSQKDELYRSLVGIFNQQWGSTPEELSRSLKAKQKLREEIIKKSFNAGEIFTGNTSYLDRGRKTIKRDDLEFFALVFPGEMHLIFRGEGRTRVMPAETYDEFVMKLRELASIEERCSIYGSLIVSSAYFEEGEDVHRLIGALKAYETEHDFAKIFATSLAEEIEFANSCSRIDSDIYRGVARVLDEIIRLRGGFEDPFISDIRRNLLIELPLKVELNCVVTGSISLEEITGRVKETYGAESEAAIESLETIFNLSDSARGAISVFVDSIDFHRGQRVAFTPQTNLESTPAPTR